MLHAFPQRTLHYNHFLIASAGWVFPTAPRSSRRTRPSRPALASALPSCGFSRTRAAPVSSGSWTASTSTSPRSARPPPRTPAASFQISFPRNLPTPPSGFTARGALARAHAPRRGRALPGRDDHYDAHGAARGHRGEGAAPLPRHHPRPRVTYLHQEPSTRNHPRTHTPHRDTQRTGREQAGGDVRMQSLTHTHTTPRARYGHTHAFSTPRSRRRPTAPSRGWTTSRAARPRARRGP